MNEKNDKNEDDAFDLEKLIGDFSSEIEEGQEEKSESGENEETDDISQLLANKDDKSEIEEDESSGETKDDSEYEKLITQIEDEADSAVVESFNETSSEESKDEDVVTTGDSEEIIEGIVIDLDASVGDEGGDYASVLGQIEGSRESDTSQEEPDSESSEEIVGETEIVDMSDISEESMPEDIQAVSDTDVTGSFESIDESPTGEVQELPDEDLVKFNEEDFSLEDLESEPDTSEEHALSESEEPEGGDLLVVEEEMEDDFATVGVSGESGNEEQEKEDDFLGLSGVTTGSASDQGGAPTEILLEGVEMDFDEQVSQVTLAEILLAQSKQNEALEIFTYISEHKGTTPWVTKRLAELAARTSGEA
ncbi:hypothetical protein ACFL1R_02120 [Candidatus Latescibacterota bacterium]